MTDNLTIDVLMRTYNELKQLTPQLGFDGIHANIQTILRWEHEIEPNLSERESNYKGEASFMGIKIIERPSMPDGYVALTNGDGIVGFVDLNNETFVMVEVPIHPLKEYRDD